MVTISEIFHIVLQWCTPAGLAFICISLVLLIFQLIYHVRFYGRISKYRLDGGQGDVPAVDDSVKGISVIVTTGDDFGWLENILPRFAAQDYGEFELVVVEVGTTEDFSDNLIVLRERYPFITTTKIESDPRFPISEKMAYNVGIKAARYDNIIITTTNAVPQSDKWLSCMARGFGHSPVVLGYAGMEDRGTISSRFIRADRLAVSVRWLAAAYRGNPYRGSLQNMGFSKELYFSSRGFNYLNMNVGIEDLFLQRITAGNNVSLVLNPKAAVIQKTWGDGRWWWQERKLASSTYKYYPGSAKTFISAELGSRILFYVSVAAAASLLPLWGALGMAGLIILRAVVVSHQMWRVRRRLGERRLGAMLVLHDLAAPFYEGALALWRKIRPAPGIYR